MDDRLHHRAIGDPDARAILADRYEEEGEHAFARLLRQGATRRDLERALGCDVRERSGFVLAEGQAGVLGWRSLAWHVLDARKLDRLLACPTFAAATRVHLHDPKGRSASPTLVAELARRRPDLAVIEVTGRRFDAALAARFPELRALHVRLAEGSPNVVLSVAQLVLTVDHPDDLAGLASIKLPHVREIGLVCGRTRLDRASLGRIAQALPAGLPVSLSVGWPALFRRGLRERGHRVGALTDPGPVSVVVG